jgi:hypothetical protein
LDGRRSALFLHHRQDAHHVFHLSTLRPRFEILRRTR